MPKGDITMYIRLDDDMFGRLSAIAKAARTDMNTVMVVLLATETMRPREYDAPKPKAKKAAKK